MEKELLEQIKFVLSCNNEAQAIMLIEKYGHYRHEQALQLHKTQVSGSFIKDSEKLSDDVIKYFPKFFDDFTNFEYGTGRDAGKDFKKIFNKAKRLKTKIGKNYR